MRHFFRRFLPDHARVREQRWLRPFAGWLHHPNLWHLNRHSVAGGVAVGLFCGLVPGPLQMLSAGLLAVLWRVNLPVALFSTLYTNPLTIVPLYALAYKLGGVFTGGGNGANGLPHALPALGWDNWLTVSVDWVVSLGKPLAIGLPLLAGCLALTGYFAVRVLWRFNVLDKWRKRARARAAVKDIS